MTRTASSGDAYVWFQLTTDPDRKIEWPLEEFLAYSKVSTTECELRLQLWDSGQISDMTEADWFEVEKNIPLRVKSRIPYERYKAAAGRR